MPPGKTRDYLSIKAIRSKYGCETSSPDIQAQSAKASLRAIFFVSFLWSMSSLMVVSVLPQFLSKEIAVNHQYLGLIEGIATFLSFLTKVFSGVISDWMGNRRSLMMLGSILTVVARPLLAFAAGPYGVLGARTMDRASKGLRASPTDALIADLCPESGKLGLVYGMRQSIYTFGAVVGAMAAMVFLSFNPSSYRVFFYLAAIPSLLAVIILAKYVKVPIGSTPKPKWIIANRSTSVRTWFNHVKSLPSGFWYLMMSLFVIMVARFSEIFITLHGASLNITSDKLPLIVIVMDVVHASLAFPLGKLSDQVSKQTMLVVSVAIQALTAAILSRATCQFTFWIGICLSGIYMAASQGILRSIIANETPKVLRGTGFAIFYFVTGVAVLIGNSIAGALAHHISLSMAFKSALLFSTLGLFMLLIRPFMYFGQATRPVTVVQKYLRKKDVAS